METALQTFQVTMPLQNAQTFTEMFSRMGWQVVNLPQPTNAEAQQTSFQCSFSRGYQQAVFGTKVRDAHALLAELRNA